MTNRRCEHFVKSTNRSISFDSHRVLAAGRVGRCGGGVVDVLLVLVCVGDGVVVGVGVVILLRVGAAAVPVRHELQGDHQVVEDLDLLE